jgi:4-amino-4-deoxy-L-arabinose transferase-like glycosyltransferase
MIKTLLKVKKEKLVIWLIVAIYLTLHLISLTNLPVFADESIYIRWAQLIIDDWQQYLFFALNDGKTPIFVWLLVPFQFIFTDPLFAGRIVSVITGLVQLFVMKSIAKELNLEKKYQWLCMLFTALSPFWFFHHQLAIMDGLLTLFLSLSVLQVLKLIKLNQANSTKNTALFFTITLAGFFLGLAILTKIPALLFVPSLLILAFIFPQKHPQKSSLKQIIKVMNQIIGVIAVGLVLFLSLKLHPAFGQLFSRGNDFLFSWQEIVFDQKWQVTIPSWPNYLSYFWHYLTWPILIFSLIGIFSKERRKVIVLNLGWIFFALPIFLLGRVIYPRYLFPVSIFITLAALFGIKVLINKNVLLKTLTLIMITISLWQSLNFIYPLVSNIEQTPFVPADREQYLTEWSAGFGIKETVDLIQKKSQDKNVLVLSEGYFGTLPDGLLMYLHREDVTNLFVIGIGQPISRIDSSYKTMAQEYDQILLVGNSHRLKIDLSQAELTLEACRPFSAPCHQVWDITFLIKKS